MFPVIYFTPSAAIYAQLKWRLMLFKQTRFLPRSRMQILLQDERTFRQAAVNTLTRIDTLTISYVHMYVYI